MNTADSQAKQEEQQVQAEGREKGATCASLLYLIKERHVVNIHPAPQGGIRKEIPFGLPEP